MCSMLHRPSLDSSLCQRTCLEAPGDLASEVRLSNLIAAPGSMARGADIWVSAIDKPLPFRVMPMADYHIGINVGAPFRLDLRVASEKSSLSLGAGGAYLQPPGADLHLTCSELQTYRLLSFSCAAGDLEQMASDAGLPLAAARLSPRSTAQADRQTLALSQAIIAELQSDQALPMLLDTLTQALAIHILRRATTPARPAGGLAPYVLQRVVDYVHEHYQDPISLDELAAVAGLSNYHFCRMFKRSTGLPPHQYLAQQRIEHARQALLHSSLPVGDIAFRSGFGSSSQFSHCFRQQLGCTPQQYRRQARSPDAAPPY